MTVLPLRAAVRTAGTGALLALLVAAGATAAHAHDELLDSDPDPGAHLDEAPDRVTLSFSDDILTIGPAVVVADTHGDTWTAGEPVLSGSSVVVPLVDDVPDGTYEVRWRVVSADGHPISGVVPFTVGDVTAVDTPAAAGTAAPTPAVEDGAPATPSPTSPSWVRPALVGAGGALAATGLFWVASRLVRRRASAATPPDGSS